jgi:hypothetical protein
VLVAAVAFTIWLLKPGDDSDPGTGATQNPPTVAGGITDQKARSGEDAANRLIFWRACEDVASLTNPELDTWKARGVDGFVCMTGRLRGLGGAQDFSGDPNAKLTTPNYAMQRSLRDTRIVERAKARGMKLYLGVYLANYYNDATPLEEWFDDAGWQDQVLPKMRNLAAAAKLYGFAGIALDQELYPSQGGVETATWSWDYPGNTRSESAVRAKARKRGAELMGAILDGYPGAELAVYHFDFPDDWNEVVQEEVNGLENVADPLLHLDFWNGMTSVEGYGAIRFFENIFYKAPHRGSWESALTYNTNQVFATFSRSFSNWDYASRRIYVSPFSWINPGPNAESAFDDARPPAYVQEQLLAFRKWGMGGEFANFVYGPLRNFDYSPYVPAMQAGSNPGHVDGVAPTLELTAAGPSIEGTAQDNLAIRSVRWRDDRGRSGVARMTWEVISGDYDSGYEWQTRWSFPADDVSPAATRVEVITEDIKGNRATFAVRL